MLLSEFDNLDIVYCGYYGSHLYGTNTAISDIDYRGIYLPSFEDTILNRYDDSKSFKDNGNDIELYSLQKFIKMALQGQTVCFDMMYSPKDKRIKSSYLWNYIIDHRNSFNSKQLKKFISYARNQAFHYSDKNDRMYVLNKILNYLNNIKDDTDIFGNHLNFLNINDRDYDIMNRYCIIKEYGDKIYNKFINIIGAEIQLNTEIRYVKDTIYKKLEKFGKRVISNFNTLDLKAMSHAYRISVALIHLIEDSEYTYPLPETDIIMNIKKGIFQNEYIIKLVEDTIDKSIDIINNSNLPDEPNVNFWNNWLVKVYGRMVVYG
jgi:hypothetical protein